MATPTSAVSAEMRAGVKEQEALETLASACALPVLFACRALISYSGLDSPLPTYTLAFRTGDYIHFKKQYSEDWYIGRVVGHETGNVGFIPSSQKLCALFEERDRTREREMYEPAPVMRPVVFLGPSLKDSQLTELLQKALVKYMRGQFVDRLVTIKPDHSVLKMSEKQARALKDQIYHEGKSLKLIFLDCDASFPSELARSLHPHTVYIQIANQKVLHKLVKEMTPNSRERDAQLEAAYRLYESPHPYSCTLTDSNLDDACQNLELFLESYWAATRSIFTLHFSPPSQRHTSTASQPHSPTEAENEDEHVL